MNYIENAKPLQKMRIMLKNPTVEVVNDNKRQ